MSTDDSDAAPDFIGDEWLFNDGWSFQGEPDSDLADPAQLGSPRPWDRLLFIFAEAKRGRFDHTEVLTELLEAEKGHPLFLAAMYLAACVGGASASLASRRWIDSEWFTQAAAAVVLAGDLSAIETLLNRRRGASTEVKETMESAISHLLEMEPDRYYETELDDDAYDALVRAQIAILVARDGADFRYTLGAPLRPRTLLAKLTQLSKLDRDPIQEASAALGTIAFHLETLTGISSVGIVAIGPEGNDVVDRSWLGRFLEANEKWDAKHRPRSGRRMFFGHVVPERP